LAEVEKFAEGEYAVALMKGAKITEEEKDRVAAKLSQYTGLSIEFVKQANLRIDQARFCKQLLRSDRTTIGRYDSRLKGADKDAAGERQEYDPSYASVQGAYTFAINDYLRKDLGFKSDLKYEILTGKVQPWNYDIARNRYLNVAPTLRAAMTTNPSLKVYVANGYYDLATPYFATKYTMDHLGLEPALLKNITMGYYDAGHMMYTHKLSHEKLHKEVESFIKASIAK
jgi:carboxypeptidase C (cathepsin A)